MSKEPDRTVPDPAARPRTSRAQRGFREPGSLAPRRPPGIIDPGALVRGGTELARVEPRACGDREAASVVPRPCRYRERRGPEHAATPRASCPDRAATASVGAPNMPRPRERRSDAPRGRAGKKE